MGQGSSQLQAVIPGMQEGIDNPEVQISGLENILNFVQHSASNKALAVKSGAVEAVVAALNEHKRNDDVLKLACDTILALLSDAGSAETTTKIALNDGAARTLTRYLEKTGSSHSKKKHKKKKKPSSDSERVPVNVPLVCAACDILSGFINALEEKKDPEIVEALNKEYAKEAGVICGVVKAMQRVDDEEALYKLCNVIITYANAGYTDKKAVEISMCASTLAALFNTHAEKLLAPRNDDAKEEDGTEVNKKDEYPLLPTILKAISLSANFSTACREEYNKSKLSASLVSVVHQHNCSADKLNAALDTLGFLCSKNNPLDMKEACSVILDLFVIIRQALKDHAKLRRVKNPDEKAKNEVKDTLYESVFLLTMLCAKGGDAMKLLFPPEEESSQSSQDDKKPSNLNESEASQSEGKKEKKEKESDKEKDKNDKDGEDVKEKKEKKKEHESGKSEKEKDKKEKEHESGKDKKESEPEKERNKKEHDSGKEKKNKKEHHGDRKEKDQESGKSSKEKKEHHSEKEKDKKVNENESEKDKKEAEKEKDKKVNENESEKDTKEAKKEKPKKDKKESSEEDKKVPEKEREKKNKKESSEREKNKKDSEKDKEEPEKNEEKEDDAEEKKSSRRQSKRKSRVELKLDLDDDEDNKNEEEQNINKEIDEIKDGVSLLLKVLEVCDDSRTQTYCFIIFTMLAPQPNKRAYLGNCGIMEVTLNLLKKGPRRIPAEGLKCVRRFLFENEHIREITRKEELPNLAVTWLKASFPSNAHIEQACSLLRTTCVFMKNDITQNTKEGNKEDAPIEFTGLGKDLINQLCDYVENNEDLGRSAKEAIIGAIAEDVMIVERDKSFVPRSIMTLASQLLIENADSLECSIGLAHSLGCFARQSMLEEEDMVIVPLTTVMRKHIHSPEVQMETCRAFCHLFVRCKWSLEPAGKEGAIELLMDVLSECTDLKNRMRRALGYALPAIAEAAKNEQFANKIIAANGLATFVGLVECQSSSEDSLQSCFMLSMTLSRSNDMNRSAIARSPILKLIIDNLNELHNPSTTLAFALKTLSNIVFSREAARIVEESGVINPLMKMFHTSRSDTKFMCLQEHAILSLANVASKCPGLRSKIISVGGIDDIMDTLITANENPSLLKNCFLALSSLSLSSSHSPGTGEENDESSESGAQAVAAHGAISAIVKGMESCPDDAGVQNFGCIALANIVHKSQDRCEQFDGANGMEAVFAALRTFSDNEQVQLEGLRFFAKYCEGTSSSHSKKCARNVGKEGVDFVIAAMKQFPTQVFMQEMAARVVVNTAGPSDKMKKLFQRQDTVELLIKAAKELTMSQSLQKMLTEALQILDPTAIKEAFLDDETKVSSILDRLKACSDEPVMKIEDAEKVLNELATFIMGNKKIIQDFVDKEIVITLSPYMTAISENIDIARRCTRVLYILAESNEQAKQELLKYGVISHIVNAMTQYSTDAQVQKHCCGLLSVLAMNNEKNIDTIVDADGIHLVIAAMKNHRGEEEVQRFAAFSLSALVLSHQPSVASTLEKENAIREIIENMKSLQQSSTVLEYSMLALANICMKGKGSENVNTASELGVVPLVIDALRSYTSNLKMMKNGFYLGTVLMAKEQEKNRIEFGKPEYSIVPIVTRVLANSQKNPVSASTTKYAFLFSGNLCLSSRNRALFSNKETTEAILHAYEMHSDNGSVVGEGGRAIAKITYGCEKNQELFFEAGAIALLGKSLEKNPTVAQIAQYHCLALGQILNAVKKSQKEPLLGSNVISAVFNVVKHNTCSTPIIEALAFTISRAVNYSNDDRDFFAKNSAMPVILFMLNQLSANAKITTYAADMLSALASVHTALATQFVGEMKGIPLIVKLLQEHSLEERTCGSLLKCLSVLLQVKKESLQSFIQVSGPNLTLITMRAFPNSEVVQEAGSSLLSESLTNVVLSFDNTLLSESEGVLLAAVQKFPSNKSISVSVALCGSILVNSPTGSVPFFLPQGDSFKTVLQIAKKHKDSPRVLAACFRAFANVATSPSPDCATIGEEGSLAAVADFLKHVKYNGTDEAHAIEFGTLALANLLARCPKSNIPVVAKTHVLRKLLKLFQKVSESLSKKSQSQDQSELVILKNAAFVLAALNFEVDSKLFEKDVKETKMLSIILNQTKTLKNNQDIVKFLLIILCNLSAYPDLFTNSPSKSGEEDEEVVTAGDVVSLCFEVMTAMMGVSQPVINECCRLLMKYVMTIPSCIRTFCDKGGCSYIVNAMRGFMTPSITVKVAHIIHSLCGVRAASVALSRSGTVSVLLNHMVTFIADQNCVKACCSAMCGLTAQQQDVETLIQFAAVDFANEPLSSASLNAIANLSSNSQENTALFLKCNVVATLALLLTGTQSVKIADGVCRAVISLAGHGEKPSMLLVPLKPVLMNVGKRLGEAVGRTAQMAIDVLDRNADPAAAACLEKGFCTSSVKTSLGWTSVCSTCATQHMLTMERDCAVCDSCRKHCPANHVFSSRVFGPRACQCTVNTCREIGVSISGTYESSSPVMIPYGSFCTDDVLRALAKVDSKFASVIGSRNSSSVKVEFIDADGSACEFYGLDCVPVRCGEVLKLRITV